MTPAVPHRSPAQHAGLPRAGVPSAAKAWLDDPEVRLMLRVQQGDDGAFTELRDRYAARVFGYFCRQLRDRAEAEDLTQDVFLRLYRSRARYQPRARFATWIFHITQNVGRNALRSRRRRPLVRLDPTSAEERDLFETLLSSGRGRRGPTEPPSGRLEGEETARMVRDAVAELAGRQREALELHQFQDHTYAEVAAELNMTPKAAKSLLYRARNQLRENLAPFMG